MKESVKVGATYLWQFYADVEQFNRLAAVYTRAIKEVLVQYADPESIPEATKTSLLQYARSLRELAQLAKVRYTAIAEKFPKIKSDTLTKKIDELVNVDSTTKILPNPKTVEDVAIELNKVLMNSVIDDLLLATKDIYAEVAEWSSTSTE